MHWKNFPLCATQKTPNVTSCMTLTFIHTLSYWERSMVGIMQMGCNNIELQPQGPIIIVVVNCCCVYAFCIYFNCLGLDKFHFQLVVNSVNTSSCLLIILAFHVRFFSLFLYFSSHTGYCEYNLHKSYGRKLLQYRKGYAWYNSCHQHVLIEYLLITLLVALCVVMYHYVYVYILNVQLYQWFSVLCRQ